MDWIGSYNCFHRATEPLAVKVYFFAELHDDPFLPRCSIIAHLFHLSNKLQRRTIL